MSKAKEFMKLNEGDKEGNPGEKLTITIMVDGSKCGRKCQYLDMVALNADPPLCNLFERRVTNFKRRPECWYLSTHPNK